MTGIISIPPNVWKRVRNAIPAVKDVEFGAKGDGATNDSAAFTAARASAGIKYIAAADYVMGTAPAMGAGAFLMDPGAVFSGAGAPNGLPDFSREFWPDTGVGASIWRFTDRMMVGRQFTGNRLGAQDATYNGASAVGPDYLFRDATLLVFSQRGQIGVSGYSRTGDTPYAAYKDCIGVAGGVQNNRSVPGDVIPAWGLYSDLQHEVADGTSFGLEIAAKDKSGVTKTLSPYGIVEPGLFGSGVLGLHIVAGGDAATGGAAAGPSNAAVNITQNSANTGWRVGINFANAACDGNTGNGAGAGDAIRMPTGDIFRWMASATNTVAAIWAQSVTASAAVWQKFSANRVEWGNDAQLPIFAVSSVASAANYLLIGAAVAAGAPSLAAAGTDANIALAVVTKAQANFIVQNSAGVNMLQCAPIASGVNFLQISAAATTGNPTMGAVGTDANPSVVIFGKGTGGVFLRDGGGTNRIQVNATGIGFHATAPIAKPAVTGSRATGAALVSLLAQLVSYGLITDSTTA